VKTATTLCAPVFYDGDTNHFFVPAIAFEAPASISPAIALDAFDCNQSRKTLASKNCAIEKIGHLSRSIAIGDKPWPPFTRRSD